MVKDKVVSEKEMDWLLWSVIQPDLGVSSAAFRELLEQLNCRVCKLIHMSPRRFPELTRRVATSVRPSSRSGQQSFFPAATKEQGPKSII